MAVVVFSVVASVVFSVVTSKISVSPVAFVLCDASASDIVPASFWLFSPFVPESLVRPVTPPMITSAKTAATAPHWAYLRNRLFLSTGCSSSRRLICSGWISSGASTFSPDFFIISKIFFSSIQSNSSHSLSICSIFLRARLFRERTVFSFISSMAAISFPVYPPNRLEESIRRSSSFNL